MNKAFSINEFNVVASREVRSGLREAFSAITLPQKWN
jgi:hypothetical protein